MGRRRTSRAVALDDRILAALDTPASTVEVCRRIGLVPCSCAGDPALALRHAGREADPFGYGWSCGGKGTREARYPDVYPRLSQLRKGGLVKSERAEPVLGLQCRQLVWTRVGQSIDAAELERWLDL